MTKCLNSIPHQGLDSKIEDVLRLDLAEPERRRHQDVHGRGAIRALVHSVIHLIDLADAL
jgi:hypothetical protein